MLQKVSWKEYILFILIMLAIYYIYLLIKWFPKDLQKLNFFRAKMPGDQNDDYDWGKLDENQEPVHTSEKKPEVPIAKEEKPIDDKMDEAPLKQMSIAQLLAKNIKKLVERAGKEKMTREELLVALQALLREDPWHPMREEPFKQTLNNIIRVEAEMNCSIHLDTGELNELWEK